MLIDGKSMRNAMPLILIDGKSMRDFTALVLVDGESTRNLTALMLINDMFVRDLTALMLIDDKFCLETYIVLSMLMSFAFIVSIAGWRFEVCCVRADAPACLRGKADCPYETPGSWRCGS